MKNGEHFVLGDEAESEMNPFYRFEFSNSLLSLAILLVVPHAP